MCPVRADRGCGGSACEETPRLSHGRGRWASAGRWLRTGGRIHRRCCHRSAERVRQGELKRAKLPRLWSKTGKGSSRSLLFLSACGVDPPGDANADEVESQHGNSVDAHGAGIGAGANDGGNQKNGEDGVANVLPEELRAHDAKQCEEKDEYWQLKADA